MAERVYNSSVQFFGGEQKSATGGIVFTHAPSQAGKQMPERRAEIKEEPGHVSLPPLSKSATLCCMKSTALVVSVVALVFVLVRAADPKNENVTHFPAERVAAGTAWSAPAYRGPGKGWLWGVQGV